MININILERITELRQKRGWSLSQLAKEADIPISSLDNLYKRNNSPTFQTLDKLLSAFGLSYAEFFAYSQEPVLSAKQKEIIEMWDNLSHAQRKNLLPILYKKI